MDLLPAVRGFRVAMNGTKHRGNFAREEEGL
jgi:hypothetical protein